MGLRKYEHGAVEVPGVESLAGHHESVLDIGGSVELLVADHDRHVDLLVAQGHFLALHLLYFSRLVIVFEVDKHHMDCLLLVIRFEAGRRDSVLEDSRPLLSHLGLPVLGLQLFAALVKDTRNINELGIVFLQLLHGILGLGFALFGLISASAE